jgi:hypothetical protein
LGGWNNIGNFWEVRTDGKAANGAIYWGQRQRIQSPTWNSGAFVLNADSIFNRNGNIPFTAGLTSPTIDLNGYTGDTLYLSANSYARFLNSTASFSYTFDGGANITTVLFQGNSNYENERYAKGIIPLVVPAGADSLIFNFGFEGKYYFWIIDDIKISSTYPSPTLPNPALGKYLFENNIPYSVDSLGHAFAKDEMVVKFKPTANATTRDSIRNLFGIQCLATCICDTLENWKLSFPIRSLNPNDTIYTIGIEQNIVGAASTTKVQSAEPNYFTYNELIKKTGTCAPGSCMSFDPIPSAPISNPNDIKIAILDTGLDYASNTFNPYLWKNRGELLNGGQDDDNNCVGDDFIGYNFRCVNCASKIPNIPADDHSHGSHVTGIILSTLNKIAMCGTYKFIPVKTHDSLGIGTLFSTACGMYYAAQQGARVINCSWGYYAKDENSSPIMLDAVRYAHTQNSLIICSAGNDSLLVQRPHLHLPSSFREPNLIAVTASDSLHNRLLPFSNYSTTYVDVAARGDSVYSKLICGQAGYKTGTSMAAPMISGIAAALTCQYNSDTNENIKDKILNSCSLVRPNSGMAVSSKGYIGFPLPLNNCAPIDIEKIVSEPSLYQVFPTAFEHTISILPSETDTNVQVVLFDLWGRGVVKQKINFIAQTPIFF